MRKQVFGKARVPLPPAVRAGDVIVISGQTPVEGAIANKPLR